MEKPFQWGILAPGTIARKFAEAVTAVPGATVGAVASRDLARAEAFAAQFAVPRAYAGYGALVADPAIDAVYVASPHNHHLACAAMALEAGKPGAVREAARRDLCPGARAGSRTARRNRPLP